MKLGVLKRAGLLALAAMIAAASLCLPPEPHVPSSASTPSRWECPAGATAIDLAWMPGTSEVIVCLNPVRLPDGNLFFCDTRSGTSCPVAGLACPATAVSVLPDQTILFGNEAGEIYARHASMRISLRHPGSDGVIDALCPIGPDDLLIGQNRYLKRLSRSGDLVWNLPLNGSPSQIAISADGQRVAVAVRNPDQALLIDGNQGTLLHEIPARPSHIVVALSPDGAVLAVGGIAGQLAVYSCSTGEMLWQQPGDLQVISDLAMTPDGRQIGVASLGDAVTFWNLRGELLDLLDVTGTAHIAFSPDGTQIACATDRGTLSVHQLRPALSRPQDK